MPKKLVQRVNKIATEVYGERSTKTAPTQKLLADIDYAIGDYDKAEEMTLKALASQEKQFGRNHIEVAKSLSQLALIKFYKGDKPAEVEKILAEAREVMGKKLGTENPQYAEILKSVATVKISEKKYSEAFSVQFQSCLMVTFILGLLFLIGVVGFEWGVFGIEFGGHEALKPTDGAYGAVFFGMTGLHALHVVSGLILILLVYFNGKGGGYSAEKHWGVEACANYWHYVDVVWVFYYPILYLMGSVLH